MIRTAARYRVLDRGGGIPTQALPGGYNQGVLINETQANPYLEFGPLHQTPSPRSPDRRSPH